MAYEVPEVLRTLRQSDIGTMDFCGAKLWLGKVEANPRIATKAMLLGTAFHKGMEIIYRPLKMGDALDLTEAKLAAVESVQTGFALSDAGILDLDPGETVHDAVVRSGSLLVNALDYYITNIFPEIIASGEPAAVEERIDLDYRGFHLYCTVDLIDGDAVLRDHKFSSAYVGKKWPISYLSQLARYAWFLQSFGAPVLDIKLDLVSYARAFNKKDPRFDHRTFELKEAGIDMTTLIRIGKESVDNALDMIEAGIFTRNSANAFGSLGCGMCEFQGAQCANFCSNSAVGATAKAVRSVPPPPALSA